MRCDFCGGNHQNGHCSTLGDGRQEEEAHYLQNQARPQQNFQGSYQGYRGGSGSNQPYGWRPHNNAYFGPNNTSFSGPSNNSYGGSSNKGPQQQQHLTKQIVQDRRYFKPVYAGIHQVNPRSSSVTFVIPFLRHYEFRIP